MTQTQKIIFLNALVTSSRLPLTLKTRPISLEEVKELVRDRDVISFVGHEATAQLLSTFKNVPMNRAMYDPQPGDVAIVVRLKKRLEKPEDVKNISINDVEFILVEYHEY
jgi:hypothetical protein